MCIILQHLHEGEIQDNICDAVPRNESGRRGMGNNTSNMHGAILKNAFCNSPAQHCNGWGPPVAYIRYVVACLAISLFGFGINTFLMKWK